MTILHAAQMTSLPPILSITHCQTTYDKSLSCPFSVHHGLVIGSLHVMASFRVSQQSFDMKKTFSKFVIAIRYTVSPFDEAHQLLLKLPLPPRLLKIVQTSEIVYNVTGLAKVDLLQQITHLNFHILDHPTDVLHM